MSKLGICLCWALLLEDSLEPATDAGIAEEMLRGQSRDAFQFLRTHYGEFGQLPKVETVLNECDIDPDYEPSAVRVEEPAAYYAKKVIERAALNEQKKAAQGLRQALVDRDPNAVHETAKSIVQVGLETLTTLRGSVVNQKLNTDERWERYQRLKSIDGGVVGFNTPWAAMDDVTGGWRDGALITCVARLGLGKTWMSILNQVCCERQGAQVGFVSPEMTREAIELRRDAVNYRLPYRDLLKGELDVESERQYYEALCAEADGPAPNSFVASEGYVTSVLDAELFAQEREIDILFVDGMYLLNPPGDNGRMAWHERVMHVVRSLKELALKMKIPVFATGQFNRNVRSGAMRAGTESIGHSDAIGQFSDIIIGMFQDENMRVSNQMMVSLLKNREGPPIELLSNWDLIRMDFSEIGVGAEAGEDTTGFEDEIPDLF
jgi:replicative DNA helicase